MVVPGGVETSLELANRPSHLAKCGFPGTIGRVRAKENAITTESATAQPESAVVQPKREHRSAEDRREQLLDAAIAVMSARGVAGATTRAITQHAGVPHGVFHYCFRSKSELFAALFEREISKTLTSAGAALHAAADVRRGLEAALIAQLDLVRGAPEYHLALAELSLTVQRTSSLAHLAVWEQQLYRDRIRSNLEQWSTALGVRWSVPIESVAALLLITGAGTASTWLADRDDQCAEGAVAVAASSLSLLARQRR